MDWQPVLGVPRLSFNATLIRISSIGEWMDAFQNDTKVLNLSKYTLFILQLQSKLTPRAESQTTTPSIHCALYPNRSSKCIIAEVQPWKAYSNISIFRVFSYVQKLLYIILL